MEFEPECCHEMNWRKMDLKEIVLVSVIRKIGERHDSFLLYHYECGECHHKIVIRQPIKTGLIKSEPEITGEH